MKKSVIFCFFMFVTNVAWGDNCLPMTHMLNTNGTSKPTYDEYLYTDSQESEVRQEGRTGKAYLCGGNGCNIGTRIRMQGAVVGSGSVLADAVYECKNKSTGGRPSYQWVAHNINATCTPSSIIMAKPVAESEVRNAGTLYEYNGDYCKEIGASTNVNVSVDNRTNGWDFVNNIISQSNQTFRTGIETGGNVAMNVLDNATNIAVTGINGGVKITGKFMDSSVRALEIMTDGTVKVIKAGGDTISGIWKSSVDGVVQIYDISGRTLVGGLQIMKDGTVKIFDSANRTVQTIVKGATESYKATIGFFGGIITSFNDTIQTAIREGASVAKVMIQEAGATVRTAMNNTTDFAKHFTSEIIGGVKSYQINKAKLQQLEQQIAQCTTQEQVALIVERALRDAEFNEIQCRQVQRMINEYAVSNNEHLDVIEQKIGNLELEIQEIRKQNNIFAGEIERLGIQNARLQGQNSVLQSKYTSLAAEVRTKVNAKQVVELIVQNTQQFTEGQLKELYVILKEYTAKLSDGQRAEVQGMIAQYVDPKISVLDSKINRESERRAAENKVLSAMSVLNSFAASAKVSVWKTAEGNFNGARLTSDSIAGVVLGTAGGLITNSLIKKSQTKKGFEDIRCSIGGQFVAEYDDEFTVGIQ